MTGAASGIGRLMAERLHAAGARLVAWDVNQAGLDALAAGLGGERVSTGAVDLASRPAIAAAAARVLAEVGPVDVLVNNAGIVNGKLLLDASDEEIERIFAVNALAPFWATRAFLPAMIERDAGHVVTIASSAALAGVPKMVDYCATKAAALGFDEALRVELKHIGSKVRTTVVCPYYIDTGMFEGAKTAWPHLLPILQPEAVADRIVAAIRDGEERLLMPPFVGVAFLARFLPPAMSDRLFHFFGIDASMDEFVGHGGGGAPKP
ncbi:MAG: SDR family oxidoreductase [Burkholderiales bacterium]|nr:SDR family oxidoreductase [Burkholderiales bacterium]